MSKAKSKGVTKTITNPNLRNQLLQWIQLTKAALDCTSPSAERTDAIFAFVRTFVPPDVTEDDIDHFANNLVSDEVRASLSFTIILWFCRSFLSHCIEN